MKRSVIFVLGLSLAACGQPHDFGEGGGEPSASGGDDDSSSHDDDVPPSDDDATPGDDDGADPDPSTDPVDPSLCDNTPVLGAWSGVFFGTVSTLFGDGFEVQNGTINFDLTCTGIRDVTILGEITGSACNGAICATYVTAVTGKYVAPSFAADLAGSANFMGMASSAFTGEMHGQYLAEGTALAGSPTAVTDTLLGNWSISGAEILTGGSGNWVACQSDAAAACDDVPYEAWFY